jgi:pimeloyl-ACP methyl ester carboxylesterase
MFDGYMADASRVSTVRVEAMMINQILIAGAILLALNGAAAHAAERWQTAPAPPPPPHAERSGYAPVNGIRMYFAEYGKGDPILLIPIGMAPSDMWPAQIPVLSQHHLVIVADTRGQGRSSWDGKPISYDLMASDYLKLMDHLGIRKVALVGASDGAIVGLDIAMHHPERLTKLFSQGANATLDGTYDKAADPAASNAASALWEDLYRRLSPAPDRYDALHSAMEKMWGREPNYTSRQLAAIRVPIAIAMSDHDEWIKPAHARYLARTIPGARLIVLHGVSHYAALQDPQSYARAVLNFVDGR